ncbi:unnamed protein product, partial [Didymodactylos carnosus]
MGESNSTEIYVEYQFVTSEVPGGYFGTQYKDYFSVTVPSSTAAKTNLTMPVRQEPESIQIDIGVSNVADAAFQSRLNVDQYGSDVCDECKENYDIWKLDPMCSPSCQNPPMKSFDFYLKCMEAKAPCGPSGYAQSYGLVYCTKFVNGLSEFSVQGQ